ncbi:MAG: radical SAM protein [Planctomycetota bacterium]
MMESHVFGPVPSRRLGMSLGVDLLIPKTCSFNCIYCQVGRTTHHTLRRGRFVNTKEVLRDIQAALRKERKVDYVTLSGSGEPTLASNLGEVIRGIRRLTKSPIAVITNSSLLWRRAVQRDLLGVDLLVPSLDAARTETFRKVNRPVRGLRVEQIVRGLVEFRKRFKGRFWLEVLLVRGVNDSAADLDALRQAIAEIKPDRVQINTVVRPPCESYAKPLSPAALRRIAKRIAEGIPVEVIAPFHGKMSGHAAATRDEVEAMLRRRSCTVADIASSLGIPRVEAAKHADLLVSSGKAQTIRHQKQTYYLIPTK